MPTSLSCLVTSSDRLGYALWLQRLLLQPPHYHTYLLATPPLLVISATACLSWLACFFCFACLRAWNVTFFHRPGFVPLLGLVPILNLSSYRHQLSLLLLVQTQALPCLPHLYQLGLDSQHRQIEEEERVERSQKEERLKVLKECHWFDLLTPDKQGFADDR